MTKNMKNKFYLFVGMLLWSTTLNAQDHTLKLENVVNEQFGTLLESLLTDGKIDEANAKMYLETVFGYDESVSHYLQTISLSQQINNVRQTDMSFDSYLSSLSHDLLSALPDHLKKSIGVDMSSYVLAQNIVHEITSGKPGEATLSLIENIIEENAKKQALIAKLEKLTPTLEKLNQPQKNIPQEKKRLVFNAFNQDDWNEITVNMANEYKTEHNYTVGNILNTISIHENYLEVFNQVPNKDATGIFQYYPLRIFKNKDKFDFSKDFKADFWIELDQSEKLSGLGIVIGKGYELDLHSGKNLGLLVATPKEYSLTTTYSDIKQKWPYARKTDKISKNTLDFNSIKVSIVKKGTSFYCLINDHEISNVTNTIRYFPDKYFLGFKQAGSGKVKIHQLALEHL